MIGTLIPPTAAVYGVILNDPHSLQAIGPLDAAPYKGAPKAPVLYIKPAGTRVPSGSEIRLPSGADRAEVSATLGLVMGEDATRRTPANALAAVAGLVLAADLSLPHSSYYRPAIREKCFDGALPLSEVRAAVDIGAIQLHTEINGELVQSRSLSELIRSPAVLLAEISAFMTLRKGDVLLLGVTYRAPEAAAGSQVRIYCDALGSLAFSLAPSGVKA